MDNEGNLICAIDSDITWDWSAIKNTNNQTLKYLAFFHNINFVPFIRIKVRLSVLLDYLVANQPKFIR